MYDNNLFVHLLHIQFIKFFQNFSATRTSRKFYNFFLLEVTLMRWHIKLGIHLRQGQAEAWGSSLSLASVDGAPSGAACLRGCRNSSHPLSIDQSEVSPRNSPPYAQYGRNVPRLVETEKHFSVRSAACRGCRATPRLASASNLFPALSRRIQRLC